jgi:Putative prokaryotic signal transducing protein
MQPTRKDLERFIKLMGDEELIAHYRSGTLTEMAVEVALVELERRGVDSKSFQEKDAEPLIDDSEAADLVLIARYLSPTDAHILGALLESRGIYAAVLGAHSTQGTAPWANPDIGAARVMVPQAQAAEAAILLEQYNKGELQVAEE